MAKGSETDKARLLDECGFASDDYKEIIRHEVRVKAAISNLVFDVH